LLVTGLLVLLTSMTLNNREPPKTGFWRYFLQILAAAHILRVNCNEVAKDRPRQLRMKFLASNVDFSIVLSPDPL